MPSSLRWILIVMAVGLCLPVITRQEPPPPQFRPNGAGSMGRLHQPTLPQVEEEIVNPDQNLPMVHVASLAQMSTARLGAVWYGGSAECAPDVQIYFATRRLSRGAPPIWSAPSVIMTRDQAERDLERPLISLGNAILLADRADSLRLIFVTIAMGKWSGSQLNTCVSKDGGITWSRAERLTLSPFFNFSELVRNAPAPLDRSGWCVPVYQEFLGKFPELLWLTEQHGKLIARKSRVAGGCSVFQPSLVVEGTEDALILLRDYTDARRVFLSTTKDAGATWSQPKATALPNPDAGISGLRLPGGEVLVAYNDSPKDRSNLSLAVSSATENQFTKIGTLLEEPGASFSYPFLLRSTRAVIWMAYTWKSKQIRCMTFPETSLETPRQGGTAP